jgi:hypothetical protein
VFSTYGRRRPSSEVGRADRTTKGRPGGVRHRRTDARGQGVGDELRDDADDVRR